MYFHCHYHFQHCVWVVGLTWSVSFGYYTCLVLPNSAFEYSNNGLGGCEPMPQTGVLMLISTGLLYFPTTMILLYVYGTVFHSNHVTMSRKHNSCNDQCTSCYCNVSISSKNWITIIEICYLIYNFDHICKIVNAIYDDCIETIKNIVTIEFVCHFLDLVREFIARYSRHSELYQHFMKVKFSTLQSLSQVLAKRL